MIHSEKSRRREICYATETRRERTSNFDPTALSSHGLLHNTKEARGMTSMSDVLTWLGQCSGSCDDSQRNEWDR